MFKLSSRFLLAAFILSLVSAEIAAPAKTKMPVAAKASGSTAEVVLPEKYTPEQVDQILARLSDDQVRRLLIAELKKSAADRQDAANRDKAPDFGQRAAMLADQAFQRSLALIAHLPGVPGDFGLAFSHLTQRGGLHAVLMIALMVLMLAIGFGVEKLFLRSSAGIFKRLEDMPAVEGFLKAGGALLKIIPEILGIFIFALVSLILAQIFFGADKATARLFFIDALSIILIARLIVSASRLLCAPEAAKLRLLPLTDPAAALMHRNLVQLIRFIAAGSILIRFFQHLALALDSLILLILVLGTCALGLLGFLLWKNRAVVSNAISGRDGGVSDSEGRVWFREQLAALWQIPAFAYLLVVWLVWAGRLVIFGPTFDNAFLISLFIVPIYLLLDRLGQWVTTSVLGTLHSTSAEPPSEGSGIEKTAASPEAAERVPEGRYSRMARLIARLVIVIALAFWLVGIWGIQIPFGQAIMRTALKIILTLVLALLAWGFANRLIDRKLAEKKELTQAEGDAAEAGEWGAAATQDRSHTVLPMVRKFIGTVLAVMVVLNVISAFGVNIGPLLAGAGILGLAVGFGAQKIVRDILSGFFFLMDDAFRIGEYIQTSKMSGMVEAITLRNVMLRHHRGPLQIVPHSELGSITNYMRGNVVEKFNIELPYNTDIDAVRKVIKKVGQELLADEEMGPNFIEPLKSQGVRDVTNSVLTFRIKYKAKPGTQFVIRREAYKRLTEALAKKGIYYAVRKVIVDLPPQARGNSGKDDAHAPENSEPATRAALLAAGAAAALAVQEDEPSDEDNPK